MKALRRAGWNTTVVPEWEHVPVLWRSFPMRVVGRLLRPFAVREFNRALLRVAERVGTELLLVWKGYWVEAETLDRLRAMGVACYNFYTDVSFMAHGPYIPRALPHYDWVFTSKTFGIEDMREQLGVTRASVLQIGFDADLHRPLELTPDDLERFGCDVSYIGGYSPKKEELLKGLIRLRPDLRLRIWGGQWERVREPTAFGEAIAYTDLPGEDYVRAIRASKINLAIMSEARKGASRGDQVAGRTFNMPACGGFVLHEHTDEVLDYFRENEEIVCFRDVGELATKIDRYLADETARCAVADRGMAAAWASHSWDHRVAEMLDHHARAQGLSGVRLGG